MPHVRYNMRYYAAMYAVAMFDDRHRQKPEVFIEELGHRTNNDFTHLVFIGVQLDEYLLAALAAWGYKEQEGVTFHYVDPGCLNPGEFQDKYDEGTLLLIVPQTPAGVLLAIKACYKRLNYKNIDTEIAAFMKGGRDPRTFSGLGLLLHKLWSKPPRTAKAYYDFSNAVEDFVDIVVGVCGRERFQVYLAT